MQEPNEEDLGSPWVPLVKGRDGRVVVYWGGWCLRLFGSSLEPENFMCPHPFYATSCRRARHIMAGNHWKLEKNQKKSAEISLPTHQETEVEA